MEDQLRSVGADVRDFRKIKPEYFAVVRFRPSSLELLDAPLEFSRNDPAVRANYYILLNQDKTPKLISDNKKFMFSPGHKGKKSSAESSYEGHSSSIDLVQNQIQTKIYRQFVKKFGKNNVGTEVDTGYRSQIDVVVREGKKKFTFYEIKTSYSVRLSIREALAQLMEYAYYPNNNNAQKLVVASQNAITKEARVYLKNLRDKFGIPLYYQRYNPEKESLEDAMY